MPQNLRILCKKMAPCAKDSEVADAKPPASALRTAAQCHRCFRMFHKRVIPRARSPDGGSDRSVLKQTVFYKRKLL